MSPVGGSPLAFDVSRARQTVSGDARPEEGIARSPSRSSARAYRLLPTATTAGLPVTAYIATLLLFIVAPFASPVVQAAPSDLVSAGRVAERRALENPAPETAGGPGSPASTSAAVHPPERIVSLAPNLTEILFAIGAGPQIAGVTDFCDYPPEARTLPSVGGFINPNPEAILALAPDLVVVTPNVGNRPFVERLMRTGARVEVLQARDLDEVFQALETLGRASGHEAEAAALAARLHTALRAVEKRLDGVKPVRALVSIQIEPLLVAGPGSYPADLLRLAGGTSIVPEGAGSYPTLSIEQVVASAPDIIVQTRMDTRESGAANGEDSRLSSWWKRWSTIPAVSRGQVHVVDGDTLLRPGPRAIEGIELLFLLLHPDLAGPQDSVPDSGQTGEDR